MKRIFDTHCHLNMDPLLGDSNIILDDCKKNNIFLNIVGIDYETSRIATELSKKHKNVYASIGIHPNDAAKMNKIEIDNEIKKLEELIKSNDKNIIGIGETGLDFYRTTDESNISRQYYSLNKHIQLSLKYNLPLILHVRDANDAMIKFLSSLINKPKKILIHCFSGSVKESKEFYNLGCYLSISGVITFNKSEELVNVIKDFDINRIVCETDSPFLSPVPFRGKTNFPQRTKYVIEKISEIVGRDVSERIFNNSIDFFDIQD